ncbi:hypothetical protein HG263_12060 [Pseudoalteromonas sp. JBTF-M23]|uniref:Attractin/MKLN-like beta-propeller domain-containing protein n=1 Tax=Pseudoalteromonas caenipelagi TaxID=2726988 RepID=A0A849VCY6_9GAMM|nr:kelch repeat-containing protein [Pseudoalteromonas caenipelagi]NOU51262.1 hypothetical protein [Pseudoalteromonas caenipelagi]
MQRRTFLSHLALGGLSLAAAACAPSSLMVSKLTLPQWQPRKNLPRAMQEIYPHVFKGNICIAGGLQASNDPSAPFGHLAPTTDLHIYDPITNIWHQGPALPQARHHLGLVACQNQLYGIGGFAADQQNPWQVRANVFASDEQLTTWREVAPLPAPQAESVYASVHEHIHVIGGRGLNAQNELSDTSAHWIYHQGQWHQGAPLDTARNSAASAVHNGLIYIIGGRQFSQNNVNMSTVQCYDSKEDRWRTLAPMPLASAGLACTQLNDRIYAFGGEQYIYQRTSQGSKLIDSKAFNSVWSYDLNNDVWRTEAFKLTSTRHGLGAITLNNQIYIMGGAVQAGGTGTSNLLETLVL